MGRKKQQKTALPPALPPDVPEDEIEVSDEDLDFVNNNLDFAGFLTTLDTRTIDKHVNRVADAKGKGEEDALEALYEKKLRKKSKEDEKEAKKVEVDPVDALPVKTLDGQLYYRPCAVNEKKVENTETDEGGADDDQKDMGLVRLTKAEKRAKMKRSRKEAKKVAKDSIEVEETVEEAPQAAALAEIKKDLTAEEVFQSKKQRLAELGIALQADPEDNIKSLKEILQFCRDDDPTIVKFSLLSLLAVFKSIIPGYRIRLPTDKELEMKVSKEVKKTRFYESTLLSTYKAYLQRLVTLEKDSKFQHVAVRCICTMLDAAPHFNFWESLLGAVVANISSPDDVVRKLSCDTIKSLFSNEGKHGGEATVEAVRMIADCVKKQNCQMHPDSIVVFMSLAFDEDLVKPKKDFGKDNKTKYKKNRKRKNAEEPTQDLPNDKKRSRKEMMSKMRDEVAADYKAAAFTPDVTEKIKMQSETLTAVFETYFRVLKHTMHSTTNSSDANGNSVSTSHPLLSPCLSGLGKFSHLIDLDYLGDLMNYLKRLAGAGNSLDKSSDKCANGLTISERLRCCIVAFRVMRINLDALNVDLQGFFVQLYNLILEYRPGRDQGEVLTEALKIMLCDDRHHDMQKAAAFAKRLATFSLCSGSAEAMAALVTVRHLLLKNVKCRNLLENDSGGGSVSGMIARYQPYATDPNLSGALASVLWELNLLSKHYNPAISNAATGIASMSTAPGQAYLTINSPQQAFKDLSLEKESFSLPINAGKPSSKRSKHKGAAPRTSGFETEDDAGKPDEEELKTKFSQHFRVLEEVKQNERARKELGRTKLALQLYEEYKLRKKKKVRTT
ncbi:Nucleolar complex-associated protein 3 [Linum perenne]